MNWKEFLKPTKGKVIIALLIPFAINYVQDVFFLLFPLIVYLPIAILDIFYDHCGLCSYADVQLCFGCASPYLYLIRTKTALLITIIVNYSIACLIYRVWKRRKK